MNLQFNVPEWMDMREPREAFVGAIVFLLLAYWFFRQANAHHSRKHVATADTTEPGKDEVPPATSATAPEQPETPYLRFLLRMEDAQDGGAHSEPDPLQGES